MDGGDEPGRQRLTSRQLVGQQNDLQRLGATDDLQSACTPPATGLAPSPASVSPMRACAAITRKSQASASSQQPPSAKPLMAAIVAKGLSRNSRNTSRIRRTWRSPIAVASRAGSEPGSVKERMCARRRTPCRLP
jgi:hypothetical protein